MPVPVRIDFTPPPEDDVVALRIYEAPASTGPWVQIERTTQIGFFPDYISHYTTALATASGDWFSIAWEYQGGVVGPQSIGAQGGAAPSLVAKVVERVMQRDPALSEAVVAQEAEAAIQQFYGDLTDPYDAALDPTYRQLAGLVYLTMARAAIYAALAAGSGTVDSATIGIVSFKSQTSQGTVKVDELIALANKELGISTDAVFQLEDVQTTYYSSYDHSRGILFPSLTWVSVD